MTMVMVDGKRKRGVLCEWTWGEIQGEMGAV